VLRSRSVPPRQPAPPPSGPVLPPRRYCDVPLVPLYGHDALRARLLAAHARGALPASLLLHGAPGVGKQRLALWLGQVLVCQGAPAARPGGAPCGACQACRYSQQFAHPDLAWFFPRPRLSDADTADVRADYAEAREERARAHGLYAPPPGSDGLSIATVRAIVQQAAMAPALGRRKVFVVGRAETLTPHENAPAEAANAFLKLLEEPPADTTLLLTSSEPGALLPTIRSRVVSVRVPALPDADVGAFVADPVVAKHLSANGVRLDGPQAVAAAVASAAGAPGALLGRAEARAASDEAERLLRAVLDGDRAERMRVALGQGASKARGAFTDVLDALVVRLHALARDGAGATQPERSRRALAACQGIDAVERAKQRAAGNVTPPLVAAELLGELTRAFARAA